jgi:hypothetical protein
MCAPDADDAARAAGAALARGTEMPTRSAIRRISLSVHAATKCRAVRQARHAQAIRTAISRNASWRAAARRGIGLRDVGNDPEISEYLLASLRRGEHKAQQTKCRSSAA